MITTIDWIFQNSKSSLFIIHKILKTLTIVRRLLLSIIPNEKSLSSRSIEDEAGHPEQPGLAHYIKPTLIDALDLEDCPATLEGAISIYRRGSVVEFIKKKEGESGETDVVDNIINFVDCNDVEDVHLEESHSDPCEDPLEPEVQEIKIEDVKIEFEGDDVSWYECFKDVLKSDSEKGGDQEMEEFFFIKFAKYIIHFLLRKF